VTVTVTWHSTTWPTASGPLTGTPCSVW